MGELLTGINIAKEEVGNMTVETIYVAPDAVNYILNSVKLSSEEQEQLTDELVDRTKDWLELNQEEQIDKIEVSFIQGTVVKHLVNSDVIRKDCSGYSVGIRADDGAVVVEAMYVHMNRGQRREWKKKAQRLRTRNHIVQLERGKQDE